MVSGPFGLQKGGDTTRQVGGEAIAEQIAAGEFPRQTIEPQIALHRPATVAGISEQRCNMILQVLADARQADLDGDAEGGKLVRRANPR